MTIYYGLLLTAGLVLLSLGLWLFWLNPADHPTRAFAFICVCRGIALGALSLTLGGWYFGHLQFLILLYPAAILASIAGVIWFLGVYPRRRPWWPSGWRSALVLGVPLVAAFVALAVEPWLYRDLSTIHSTAWDLFTWFVTARQGPFGPVYVYLHLAMGAMALIYLREYFTDESAPRRSSLLVISLGFFVPTVCICLISGISAFFDPLSPKPADPGVFDLINQVAHGLWILLIAAILLYGAIMSSRRPSLRRPVHAFLAFVLFAIALGTIIVVRFSPREVIEPIFGLVGLWSLLGAFLVAYAMVRHHLFDIDLRIKLTLKRSTIAAVFLTAYFLATEIGGQLLEDYTGSAYIGIGAAALLLLAFRPIEDLAQRLADGAMPGVKTFARLDEKEKVEMYRDHVELIWMDGIISAKDRKVLGLLRQKLALDPALAEKIELHVVGADPKD